MSRFVGFRYEQGVVVLDTYSGQVVLIPPTGGAIQTLRAAVDVGTSMRLEIVGAAGTPPIEVLATALAASSVGLSDPGPAPVVERASHTPEPLVVPPSEPDQRPLEETKAEIASDEPPPPLAEDLAPPPAPRTEAVEDFEIETEAPAEESATSEEPKKVEVAPPIETIDAGDLEEVEVDEADEPEESGVEEDAAPEEEPVKSEPAPAAVQETPPPAAEPEPAKPAEDFESATAEIDPRLVETLRRASVAPPPPAATPERSLPPEIVAFDALFDAPPSEPIAVGEEAEVDLDADEEAKKSEAESTESKEGDTHEEEESLEEAEATEVIEAEASEAAKPIEAPKPEPSVEPTEAFDEVDSVDLDVDEDLSGLAPPAQEVEAEKPAGDEPAAEKPAEPSKEDSKPVEPAAEIPETEALDESFEDKDSEKPSEKPALAVAEASPPPKAIEEPVVDAWAELSEVATSYPTSIARAFEEMRKSDAAQRGRWVAEAIATSLQFSAVISASECFAPKVERDRSLEAMFLGEMIRPSHETWRTLLRRSLEVRDSLGTRPFQPGLNEQLRRLVFEDANTLEVLVSFCTKVAADDSKVEVAEIEGAEVALRTLLRVLAPLSNVSLYHVLEPGSGQEPLVGQRFAGAHPELRSEPLSRVDFNIPESGRPGGEWFLRDEVSLETLQLLPCFAEQRGDKGVELLTFAGYNRKSTVHRSVFGTYVDRPSRFRQYFARTPTGPKLEPKDFTFERLSHAGRELSKEAMGELERLKVIVPGLLLPRTELSLRLKELDRGDYRALWIAGAPGVGKTNALVAYAQERLEAGDVVFFYRARRMSDPDLSSRFLRDLSAKHLFLDELLRAAHTSMVASGKRLRLIVDGVDEHPTDPAGMISAIDSIVRQSNRFPWFRLVASIRTSVFDRLPSRIRPVPSAESRYLGTETPAGDEVAYLLQAPPENFMRELVAKFPAAAGLDEVEYEKTPRFANPFLQRLWLEAGLSERDTEREVLHQAIESMVSDGASQKAGKRRMELLRAFVRELDALRSHAMAHERLYEVEALRAAVVNGQIDSPYGQLVERGVLIEEREEDRCFVSMNHGALFEHLLAGHHEPQVHTADDLAELAVRALRFPSLEAAMVEVLVRSLRGGRTALALDSAARCHAILEGHQKPEHELLLRTVREALVTLVCAADGSSDELLAALSTGSVAIHAMLLGDALQDLHRSRNGAGAEKVRKALLAAIEATREVARKAELELRLARMDFGMGDTEAAEGMFRRAMEASREAGSAREEYRAAVGYAKILVLKGKADEALGLFSRAFEELTAARDFSLAAEARQNQAVLVGQKGDREGAEQMAEEARKLARDAGNSRVEVRCLNMLAIAAERRQDGAAAEKSFLEALDLATTRGLMELAASTNGSLGVLYHGRGDAVRAETHLVRELEIRREIGDKLPLAKSLKRLAVLFAHRGDNAREEQYLLESLTLLEEINDRAGVAETLSTLAVLADRKGDKPRVLELYRKALAQEEELGSKPEMASTLVRMAAVLSDLGDDDGALSSLNRALSIRESTSDRTGVADCLMALGRALEAKGDFDAAETHYERALEIRTELEDQDGVSDCIAGLGGIMERRGDLAGAEESYRKALEIDLASDDPLGAAFMYMLLGGVLYQQGQIGEAEELAKRSVARFEELDHSAGLANALSVLGVCKHMHGHLDGAAEIFERELKVREKHGHDERKSYTTWLLTSVELDRGNVDRAEEIFQTFEPLPGDPKSAAVQTVYQLRLALKRGKDAEIGPLIDAAEAAFADAPAVALEDGLATAYLEAAQYFDKRKQITRSKDLAVKAHEVVAGRPFNRQAELAAILPKLRRAPARPMRPVRPVKKPK